MNFVNIIMVLVALLILLAGITVAFGAHKSERGVALWFFLTTVGAALWSLAIMLFLNLPEEAADIAPIVAISIYIPPIFMIMGLFGFVSKLLRLNRILVIVFSVTGAILAVVVMLLPYTFYKDVVLGTEGGNIIELEINWLYVTYVCYYLILIFCYLGFLLVRVMGKGSSLVKKEFMPLFIGLTVCGFAAVYFNLILPFERYDLAWVGPIAMGVVIIGCYYANLRYGLVTIKTDWLKVMSYIVIITSAVVVYIILFYLVATFVFGISEPSTTQVVLSFVMMAIAFLLMPVLSRLTSSVSSLLSINKIDVGYIEKKLKRVALENPQNIDLMELATFLANHLHFSYVGLEVGDKIYGSKEVDYGMKEIEIRAIQLKESDSMQIWQELGSGNSDALQIRDLRVVADLRDSTGRPFGRIILGAPRNEKKFGKEEVSQLDMIVGLVGAAIGPRNF